jgi:hypothetical protein
MSSHLSYESKSSTDKEEAYNIGFKSGADMLKLEKQETQETKEGSQKSKASDKSKASYLTRKSLAESAWKVKIK